ncbi:2-ketogluconate transporter [Enterobacter rongchengensis]
MNSSTNAVKRWWYIMPIVFITYSLAYLDRANFSFASAAGITEDLGITKGVSSLLGALFFWAISSSRSPARFTRNAAACVS